MGRTDPAARPGPRRARILAAAEELFADRGFDRTSTARVAARADVPHGLVFYYFPTKLELLLAVIRERGRLVIDDAVRAVSRRPPDGTDRPAAVTALWHGLVAELGRPHPVRRIIIQEVSAHPEVRSRAAQLQDEVTAAVATALAALDGRTAPLPEHTAAARLLTTAATFGPVVYDAPQLDPDALARLLDTGLPGPELRG